MGARVVREAFEVDRRACYCTDRQPCLFCAIRERVGEGSRYPEHTGKCVRYIRGWDWSVVYPEGLVCSNHPSGMVFERAAEETREGGV